MSLDRDRLMREYAPRLAERADGLAGPQAPGGTVDDPDTLGGLLNIQVVGDVVDVTDILDATKKADDGEEPVETEQSGVMVALFLPPDAAELLALDPELTELGGIDVEEPDELHLTLAYLGTAGVDVLPDQLDLLAGTVQAWAAQATPITGSISGIGIFNNEDTAVTYASFDSPQLPKLRQGLVDALEQAGFTISQTHGFTPHVTLAYGDARGVNIPRLNVTFDDATIAYAGERMTLELGPADSDDTSVTPDEAKAVPLGQDVPAEDDPKPDTLPADGTTGRRPGKVTEVRPAFIASDRHVSYAAPVRTMTTTTPAWKPIITDSGARTIITGPATTERAAMWGTPPNPNRHLLWMQGRFVGAERANRNGAFWSTSDLEVGKPTVAHGPLNWLHEERHVIGTIADAKFIPSGGQLLTAPGPGDVAAEHAAQTGDPHITALSAIWSWIYPQEASVVQMASDAGCLAYSMECIAQAIQCVGDSGCGQTFSYMEVAAAGGGCAHLKQRASVRRLVNPTFLGGAVIVPPTRPGWADADASVMKEAARLAEHAFDQAGHPDIPANTWEQLMAGVVSYTRNSS